MADIFERPVKLKPSAMVTVAERRFDDAEALRRTGDNARANGTAYLAGFVIEILLKAQLVRKFQAIARKQQHELSDAEREVWGLIWRRHDLGSMLDRLGDLQASLRRRGERDGINYVVELKKATEWSIFARYSPRSMLMSEAAEIVERVRRLKEVLK